MHLSQSIYSSRRLIRCMPFHSSLFQCCHCDMNSKMDEVYTGKQRWGGKKKTREERGEAVMHTLPVQLMFSCLWCCASCLVLALKDTFMKLLTVFTAAALVTADEYKEKSRRWGVWDGRHVLILRTAPASVTSLFSWHNNKTWTSTERCWPLI